MEQNPTLELFAHNTTCSDRQQIRINQQLARIGRKTVFIRHVDGVKRLVTTFHCYAIPTDLSSFKDSITISKLILVLLLQAMVALIELLRFPSWNYSIN